MADIAVCRLGQIDILGELQTTFADRLSRADAEHYLKAHNTLPISDAARAFNQKLMDRRLKTNPPPSS
ncbi:MAG: hypothetical protein JWQ71_4543 [Pedosphaera sp.]|nr:hypothetical protein [Pedosphaera sp.]